jgi:hypothetical protein
MQSQEFYIRQATETDARGPYNLEQLMSLAETGFVTPETLYYDTISECWAVIDDTPEMKTAIFPEVTKLNRESHTTRLPISAGDMHAAAAGRTDDAEDKASIEIEASRAAAIGRWAVVLMLVLSAAGEARPAVDAIRSMNPAKLMGFPLAALGAVDLLLAILIGLGNVRLYPFIRFRAALGLGLFGIIFYLHGAHLSLLAMLVGSAGLYFCTVSVNLWPAIISAFVGVAGISCVVWRLSSQ